MQNELKILDLNQTVVKIIIGDLNFQLLTRTSFLISIINLISREVDSQLITPEQVGCNVQTLITLIIKSVVIILI